jgi:hypothetical protein
MSPARARARPRAPLRGPSRWAASRRAVLALKSSSLGHPATAAARTMPAARKTRRCASGTRRRASAALVRGARPGARAPPGASRVRDRPLLPDDPRAPGTVAGRPRAGVDPLPDRPAALHVGLQDVDALLASATCASTATTASSRPRTAIRPASSVGELIDELDRRVDRGLAQVRRSSLRRGSGRSRSRTTSQRRLRRVGHPLVRGLFRLG